MEITKDSAIAKIIFWQQLTLILFLLILFLFLGFTVYDIKEDLKFGYYESYAIEIGIYIVFGLLGTYNTYLLYRSLSLLKTYQKQQEHLYLELAFRKQRHFWMIVPAVLMFLLSIFIIMLIFLTVNFFIQYEF